MLQSLAILDRFLRHLRRNSLIALLIICLFMVLNVSEYENAFFNINFLQRKVSVMLARVCLPRNVTDIDKLNYFLVNTL